MKDIELLRHQNPRHILFMCVANSARSQIAEGVARFLAPATVRISSAGSLPTTIRAEVAIVLSEIGISAAEQFSKNLDQVETKSVDAVITLCAEEVCPVFPGNALRIHWALPDPAQSADAGTDPIVAFRKVRDELFRRLKNVFE